MSHCDTRVKVLSVYFPTGYAKSRDIGTDCE